MRTMFKVLENSIIYPLDNSNEKLEMTVEMLLKYLLANSNYISQDMQSRDSCVQRETSSSVTLLPTGTIKVQVKSCAW